MSTDYSQRGEQGIIAGIVAEAMMGRPGRFVDIGANDGVAFSNTRALAEQGWRGLHIEPDPRACAALRQLYAGQEGHKVMEVAVTDREDIITLYSFQDALVSTAVDEERAKWEAKAGPPTPIQVRSIAVENLEAHFPWPDSDVDMVSIDAEGWSAHITMRLPFDKWLPEAVVTERGNQGQTWAVIHRMVYHLPYTLEAITAENLIFALAPGKVLDQFVEDQRRDDQ